MYAVVRIRGGSGVKHDIRETMEFLGLKKPYACAFLPETAQFRGMLNKVKDYVAFGEVDDATAKEFTKRNLHPASGGLVSAKAHHPRGSLGYHGKDIAALMKRMI